MGTACWIHVWSSKVNKSGQNITREWGPATVFPLALYVFTPLSPVPSHPWMSLLQHTHTYTSLLWKWTGEHTFHNCESSLPNIKQIPGNSKDLLYFFVPSFLNCKAFSQSIVSCTYVSLNVKLFCFLLAITKTNWWFSPAIRGYSHRASGSSKENVSWLPLSVFRTFWLGIKIFFHPTSNTFTTKSWPFTGVLNILLHLASYTVMIVNLTPE